jgi:prevent-host-death family protein
MVALKNIHSLTDFRHNAKKYVEQLQETKSPLVLTVNGKAVLVVEDADSYEAMGAEQAEQGKFSKRSFDEIIAAAQSSIAGQVSA